MSNRPLIIGHRGAPGLEPENTLRSFRRALEIGVDLVELDVWVVEGNVVVFHDRELQRLTNGTGLLTAQSFESLRALKISDSEMIPLLTEVLDMIDKRCGVNIELKGPGTALPVVHLVQRYVAEKGWEYKNFLVSSFDHTQLAAVQKLKPQIPIGVLLYGIPLNFALAASELNALSVNVGLDFLNAELVADAHARGHKCFVYTVNSKSDYNWVAGLGVDGIFTDYPDRFK